MKKLLVFILIILVIVIFLIKPVNALGNGDSDLRYTYIASPSMQLIDDWPLLATTLKNYDMGPIVQKTLYNNFAPFPLTPLNGGFYEPNHLQNAIDASHAVGIKYHISMAIMLHVRDPSYAQIDRYGNSLDWSDACNPDFRNHIKAIVEDLVERYDIDGFGFDYVRYDTMDASYSQYCKAMFEEWLGESIPDSNWPPTAGGGGDFAGGGSRYTEFLEWRSIPISELIGLIRQWMEAKREEVWPGKPPLEFTATTFTDPVGRRYEIGQDVIFWIKEGYIDWLQPMFYALPGYGCGSKTYPDCVRDWLIEYQELTGGPEGIIPIAALPTHVHPGGIVKTPSEWSEEIFALKENNVDGWSTWAYGGPGDNSVHPDITAYYDLISRPPTFSLSDIKAIPTGNNVLITWTTDLPATSKVEYNTSQLFITTNKQTTRWFGIVNYLDIDHVPGTIVEDTTPVTSHKMTLTGLSSGTIYYYRVQSEDSIGIATSKVCTFTADSGVIESCVVAAPLEEYPVNITGIVTDSDTGLPIQGARVACNVFSDTTNSNGEYFIRMTTLTPGSCSLTASKTGSYTTKSTSFSFPNNGTYTGQNFTLDPIKVNLAGRLLDKYNNAVQANIIIYEQNTNNVVATDQTVNGDYNLSVTPNTYDVQFNISNFFIKLLSVDVSSDINNLINYVNISSDRLLFITDITAEQSIRILSSKPNRILLNNSEIENVTSSANLRKNTWYHSDSDLHLKISPDLKSDCLSKFDCCKNEERYYDKDCSSGYYCSDRICYEKQPCPYECCIDEEMYLDKACSSGEYCSGNTCIPAPSTFGKTDEGGMLWNPWFWREVRGSRFKAPASGEIISISAYFSSVEANKDFSAGIYDDNNVAPNTLLGETPTITASTSASWHTFTFSTPVSITANNYYWLVVFDNTGTNWNFYYDTGIPNQAVRKSDSFPPLDDPFGTPTTYENYNCSIYATYNPS